MELHQKIHLDKPTFLILANYIFLISPFQYKISQSWRVILFKSHWVLKILEVQFLASYKRKSR